ncbi:hypothetical protein VZT92_017273 [Zoarces viviparus]|uniref:AIG1-type G domain-containing protein n=1 Tax=Zoarces viviparus TaxID=48416 RepID=A0AAW1ERP9_ZOAVI
MFGENLFKINHTLNSETSKCRAETRSVSGRNITVIDTPGLFDTHRSEEEMKSEIVKCFTEFAPGLHAFLIVLKVEKFTDHEQAVITKINQLFSEEAFKYATVLFTHGEQLPEGQNIYEFVRDNKLVSDLVEKCGGRCHVIDNKYWKNNQQDEYRSNQFQVKEILKTTEKMIEENNGSCYTNEMLQVVEAGIKQDEERIRQSSGDMSEEEIREKAKDKVFKRLLINLAGITTGALLGAIFGGVLGEDVFKVLKNVLLELEQCERVSPKLSKTAGRIAAGAGIAETAGIARGTLVGAVIGGAIKGGIRGYDAAKGADTPRKAVKRAAEAVMDDALSVFEAPDKKAKNKSESEALLSPQSPAS